MRKIRTAVLAGVATIAAAGAAMAATHESRCLNIADGAVAPTEHDGNVARVPANAVVNPLPIAFFDPFQDTSLDNLFAQMDRQADAMMRQAAAMAAQPAAGAKPDLAAWAKMPAGSLRYSFVSMSTGNGTCGRSFQVTSLGKGQAPKMVSSSFGDCAASAPDRAPGAVREASVSSKAQAKATRPRTAAPVV